MFSARTGTLARTLVGHELGVWGLCLVSRGGYRLADPDKSRTKRTKTRSTSSGKAMPSESLEFLISPAMRIALGLDPLNDSEHEDNEDGHSGCGADVEPIWHEHEDSTYRHAHARRRGSAEEEDLPGTGVDPARNPDKPSSMCYSSQGWGQPNSLIISGGCDKVVRVWDAESG